MACLCPDRRPNHRPWQSWSTRLLFLSGEGAGAFPITEMRLLLELGEVADATPAAKRIYQTLNTLDACHIQPEDRLGAF